MATTLRDLPRQRLSISTQHIQITIRYIPREARNNPMVLYTYIILAQILCQSLGTLTYGEDTISSDLKACLNEEEDRDLVSFVGSGDNVACRNRWRPHPS
ncbi:hypothetical protein YC2023_086702 [Brassica napus]